VNLKALLSRLNRAQRTRRFKVIATIVVAVIAAGSYAGWLMAVYAPTDAPPPALLESTPPDGGSEADEAPAEAIDPSRRRVGPRVDAEAVRALLGARSAALPVALGTLAATGLAVVVIWLGLGLTYLALLTAAGAVGAPLALLEPTRGLGLLVLGGAALTASFTILIQAARLLLSRSEPVFAISRNVLNEAVRMKIGLIFIVLVILLLLLLPGLLDQEQPLRYRVQSFLQYSVGGTFWVLAIMTVFFAAGTVAFDQRDRTIWQTMAKPVAPWQYILGKWLGVVVLNGVLLSVTASGVFLFTEYLRRQPANAEVAAYVPADGGALPTDDRRILETQVLTARASVEGDPEAVPQEAIARSIERRVEQAIREDASLRNDPARLEGVRRRIAAEVRTQAERRARSIPIRSRSTWTFDGLERAERVNQPVTLRFKFQAGADDPEDLFTVAFRLIADEGADRWLRRQIVLNQFQTLTFYPLGYNAEGEVSDLIDPQGRLTIEVYNGDPLTGQLNPREMRVPPEGIEALYEAGSYELNFFRVVAALLVKLAFVAAVAVAAATFVSFPVACLIAGAILFMAETSGFLAKALQEYPYFDQDGNLDPVAVFIRTPTLPFAVAFSPYAELQPTENLVEGRLVPWSEIIGGVTTLLAASLGVLSAGWIAFRRRELAMYSGH